MPSSRYKRMRISKSEPPRPPPDDEISYRRPVDPLALCPRYNVLNSREVLSEVFSYLNAKDLHSATLVNKPFNRAAVPLLYSHVDLSMFRRKDEPAVPRKNCPHIIKSVTLYAHRVWNCNGTYGVGSAKVDTILLNNHDGPKTISGSWCYPCPETEKMEAKRLVVLPPELGRYKVSSWFFVPRTDCPEVTVLLRPLLPGSLYNVPGPSWGYYPTFGDPVENPSKNLTIVLLPHFWDDGLLFTKRPKFFDPLKLQQNMETLMDMICMRIKCNPEFAVTLVGLEEVNPFAGDYHWIKSGARENRRTTHFIDRLKETFPSKWTREQQDLRLSSVDLVSFEDYLRNGEWSPHALSPILVNRWLNLLDLRRAMDGASGKKKRAYARKAGFLCHAFKKKRRNEED